MATLLRRPVALVGLMGAGKSAVARALARRFDARVFDLDGLIEAEAGCPIPELFARQGEPYFRRREAELLRRALDEGAEWLACGGGIVLDAANRALLRERCDVVWLQVSPPEAARRLSAAGVGRPLLEEARDPAVRLAALLAARAPLYGEVATHVVSTEGRSVAEVADDVLSRLIAPRGAAR